MLHPLKFNSKFSPEKWCLEDKPFLLGKVTFQGKTGCICVGNIPVPWILSGRYFVEQLDFLPSVWIFKSEVLHGTLLLSFLTNSLQAGLIPCLGGLFDDSLNQD